MLNNDKKYSSEYENYNISFILSIHQRTITEKWAIFNYSLSKAKGSKQKSNIAKKVQRHTRSIQRKN